MYSPRIDAAIVTALDAHGLKRRKTGGAFEASHVIGVALIVDDFGFDEDTVVAALLHDTLEDTSLSPEALRARFGEAVLAIVEDVTEPVKQLPWRERKRAYIERLRRSPRAGARAVASADKIHNLTKMIEGLRSGDPDFWPAFNASLEQTVEYQQAVLRMLEETWDHPILGLHARVLSDFLAAASDASPPRR